jgi:hypothetical protein
MKPGNPIDGRRLFFRYAARETAVWLEELGGRRHVKFDDLAKLPPEEIAALVPKICPGVQIVPEDGRVSARLPGASEVVALFQSDDANLAVFNGFNGQNTIGKVAGELSAAMAWPQERSLAHVKQMFMRLLRLRVCVPANDVSSKVLP